MGNNAFSDRIVKAISKCKNEFTIDDVLEYLDFDEPIEEIEPILSEEIEELVKEGYLQRDKINCIYIFAGD